MSYSPVMIEIMSSPIQDIIERNTKKKVAGRMQMDYICTTQSQLGPAISASPGKPFQPRNEVCGFAMNSDAVSTQEWMFARPSTYHLPAAPGRCKSTA